MYSIIWYATEKNFDASLTGVIDVVDWDVGLDLGVGCAGLGVGPKESSNHKKDKNFQKIEVKKYTVFSKKYLESNWKYKNHQAKV